MAVIGVVRTRFTLLLLNRRRWLRLSRCQHRLGQHQWRKYGGGDDHGQLHRSSSSLAVANIVIGKRAMPIGAKGCFFRRGVLVSAERRANSNTRIYVPAFSLVAIGDGDPHHRSGIGTQDVIRGFLQDKFISGHKLISLLFSALRRRLRGCCLID